MSASETSLSRSQWVSWESVTQGTVLFVYVRGADRSYDLVSTPADAKMGGGCEAYRDIDRALLQLIRNELDEFMFESDFGVIADDSR